ncbi:MAG: DUF4013 domain-containing protein, partial [Anaerolineales bacterium]|nr:DUF4013 domain-containing protein [Anaerolineales bacterium]
LLIPIIGPMIVAGWGYEITRRVINNDSEPLPDWSDFGGYLGKGFQVIVLGFVYALPLILIQGCIQGGVALAQNQPQDNTIVTAITVVSLCVGCISFIYAVFMGFTLPAAIGNFAAKGNLGAGFRFSEVFGLVKAAPGAYLLVLLGGIVSSFVASIGVIACAIGVLLTSAYAAAINSHLTGQAYVQATEMLQPEVISEIIE